MDNERPIADALLAKQKNRRRLSVVPATVGAESQKGPPEFTPRTISPSLFEDLRILPVRPWIIKNTLLRGYITSMLAPGGVGKSIHTLCMGTAVASGKADMGFDVVEPCRVLIINNEDDHDELARRNCAIHQRFGVSPEETNSRLFIHSGFDSPFTVSNTFDRSTLISPLVAPLVEFCLAKQIGVVIVDPFVSTHDSNENDNVAIQQVMTKYRRIASDTDAAVMLVHHTKKGGLDSEIHAGDPEAGRGASALIGASRCSFTLAKMNDATANKLNIPEDQQGRYIRMDDGKMNYSLAARKARWFYMQSVRIPNGDSVGVPTQVNLELDFDKAECNDGKTKWTATAVAEALEKIVIDRDRVKWTEIRPQFMGLHHIGKSAAHDAVMNLPQKAGAGHSIKPTRIRNSEGVYVEYFLYKEGGGKSPWYVCRNEVSE